MDRMKRSLEDGYLNQAWLQSMDTTKTDRAIGREVSDSEQYMKAVNCSEIFS